MRIPNPARPVVRGRALRYLRLLSLFAGVLALVHPPLLLRRIAHILPDIAEPFVMLGGMLLAAGGYFVIGLVGHRMRRSPLLRACGFLMAFTLVLYMSFIYPLMHTPRPRQGGRPGRYSQPASRAMR